MIQKIFLATFLFLFAGIALTAQSKVREKDLVGTWKMVIPDMENALDRHAKKVRTKDADDAGERFEQAIENAVGEFVGSLLEDFEIEFTFLKDHRAKMDMDILGEHETEYLEWYITDDGGLVLIDENDNADDDEKWMMEGNRLVQYEKKGNRWEKDDDSYMVKIK